MASDALACIREPAQPAPSRFVVGQITESIGARLGEQLPSRGLLQQTATRAVLGQGAADGRVVAVNSQSDLLLTTLQRYAMSQTTLASSAKHMRESGSPSNIVRFARHRLVRWRENLQQMNVDPYDAHAN